MEEEGEVGPGIVGILGRLAGLTEVAGKVGMVELVNAALWIAGAAALRRPFRYLEQVLWQAPRGVRLEHVVLQDEIVGVGPIVAELGAVVETHHVEVGVLERASRIIGILASLVLFGLRLLDEAVHLAPVDIVGGGSGAVAAPEIPVVGVVKRFGARAFRRVGDAYGELAVLRRQA